MGFYSLLKLAYGVNSAFVLNPAIDLIVCFGGSRALTQVQHESVNSLPLQDVAEEQAYLCNSQPS